MKKNPFLYLLELVGPLVFFLLAIATAGTALGLSVWVFDALHPSLANFSPWIRYPATGMLLALGFYVYGFSLMFIAPLVAFVLRAHLKPYRGPAVSLSILRWYLQAALVMLVRYSFLEFVTPTLYGQIFYRLMGMKIGSDVYINSTNIVDPSMIEMGDRVTIGGSANIMAHYSQGGYLIIAPVKIGRGATVGLRATLMGGVEIGEKAKVLANSFVLPNTKIPAGETWGGIPASRVEMSEFRQKESV